MPLDRPMPTPLRIAPFLFALLCFLLPFAEVSCDSKDPSLGSVRVVKVTGWELMTGNKTDEQHPNRAQSHDPNYLLLASAALLILGLLAAASPRQQEICVPLRPRSCRMSRLPLDPSSRSIHIEGHSRKQSGRFTEIRLCVRCLRAGEILL